MAPHTIISFSSSFLMHILDSAVRSIVIGCVAAAMLYVLRVKTPSARLAVWTGVLYGALSIPILALAMPSLSVPLPAGVSALFAKTSAAFEQPAPARRPAASAFSWPVSSVSADAQSDASQHVTLTMSRSAMIESRRLRASIASQPAFAEVAPARLTGPIAPMNTNVLPSATHAGGTAFSWSAITLLILSLISVVLLARIALGAIFAHRLARSAETIADCDAIRVLLRQARAAGVASAPRLAESEVVSVPVALGIMRPTILLPLYWRSWDERTLAAVIAHEMSHIARRDALTQRLALVHRAIFWFSPFAWWLNRTLADTAEEASDEAALAAGTDQAFYAETLLGFFAALSENSGRVYWQGVSMATPGQADRRVDRILNWKGTVSMRLKKSLAVGLALVGVPVVLLTAAARPTTTPSSAPVVSQAPTPAAAPAPPAAPAAAAVPVPVIPMAPSQQLPQPAPAAEPAPAQSSQTLSEPPAPPAPQAVPSAPEPPNVVVNPEFTVDREMLKQEIEQAFKNRQFNKQFENKIVTQILSPQNVQAIIDYAGSGVTRQVLDSVEINTIDAIQKQLTITMQNTAQLSSEDQEKLDDLQQKLTNLRTRYAEDYPEVVKLKAQIAQAETQAQTRIQAPPNVNIKTRVMRIGDDGDRFVIVSGDSPIIMSGDSEDVEHATALRGKINGDFIWFQHDEKSYVIRDQALVNQAKALFKPEQDLGEKQQALGKQQQALGDQMRALGDKMRDVHVTLPDMSADMEKLEAQMKQLSTAGGTEQQIGDLQRQMGDLMRRMNQTQSQAGDQQRQIGEQMRALGEQQRQLGDQQRDLGRQQRDANDQARLQMKQLLDDAVAKGTAQPE